MKSRSILVASFSLALLSSAGIWAWAQPTHKPPAPAKAQEKDEDHEPDEQVIDFANAPQAVRTAAMKLAGNEKLITKVTKEEDEGIYTYEIEFTVEGVECSAIFSGAGDLIEIERATTEAKLPADVMKSLRKEFPGATFKSPVAVTRMFYEIEVVKDGKSQEVRIDAAGRIEDTDDEEDGDDDEHDEVHEKVPPHAGPVSGS